MYFGFLFFYLFILDASLWHIKRTIDNRGCDNDSSGKIYDLQVSQLAIVMEMQSDYCEQICCGIEDKTN